MKYESRNSERKMRSFEKKLHIMGMTHAVHVIPLGLFFFNLILNFFFLKSFFSLNSSSLTFVNLMLQKSPEGPID